MVQAAAISESHLPLPRKGDRYIDSGNFVWSVHDVRMLGPRGTSPQFLVRMGRADAGGSAATMALTGLEFFKLATAQGLRPAAKTI